MANTMTDNKINLMDLPIEVRLQIWECCFPKGRLIKLRSHAVKSTAMEYEDYDEELVAIPRHYKVTAIGNRGNRHTVLEGGDSIPLLMHINRETRQVAQKHYVLGLDGILGGSHLYWNPSKDIIHLETFPFYRDTPAPFLRQEITNLPTQIKSLAFNLIAADFSASACSWISKKYPSLECLYLLLDPRKRRTFDPFPTHPELDEELVPCLHRPTDVPIYVCNGRTRTQVEEIIEGRFEGMKENDRSLADWEPPTVEVCVVVWKRPRRSGFYTPLATSQTQHQE
ncbi:hypothetical protein B0O99DRAFT_611276 [Bisporella sp. PMI_857]|nr:hypothetical protein B0O99DRAFT_611276 [Bisporella sp. PMI_857]